MTDRVLKRINEAPDDQTAYEAQQQLKSIYHRLRSRQKLKEAYELLSKGCISHIATGQVHSIRTLDDFGPHGYGPLSSRYSSVQVVFLQITCAGELGRLLVGAYLTDQCPTDDEHAARVLNILDDLADKESTLDSAAKTQVASEGSQVAKGALKWAKQQVRTPSVRNELHSDQSSSTSNPCTRFCTFWLGLPGRRSVSPLGRHGKMTSIC